MVGAINNFGWKYFKRLNLSENIFYSPYSIVAALSIAANGAIKATRAEILSALGAANVEFLNSGFKTFRDTFAKNYSGKNILRDTNLMLVNQRYIGNGINPTFENVITNIYDSEIRAADFEGNLSSEKAEITEWIDRKTSHFLPNCQVSPTAKTIIALLNVIYFKGAWHLTFDEENTRRENFTNHDGSKSSVKMMNKSFSYDVYFHSDENFKGIRLPYKDLTATMYLILPRSLTLKIISSKI